MLNRLAVALFVAIAVSVASAQQTKFEVYPLMSADPEIARDAVQAIVGEEGHITVDRPNRRLLVATTPERHALIAEFLAKLDSPPRNVLIQVEFLGAGQNRQAELSVQTSGAIGIEQDGLSGRWRIRPHLQARETEWSGRNVQTLLVTSGREAYLQIGEEVPYLDWLIEYGFSRGWITRRLAWQKAGAFLSVQPTVIGDGPLIAIRLTPELRGLADDGRPARARFAALTTEVTVRDGEEVRLGGLAKDREFFDRFLVGSAVGGAVQSLDIRLLPRIQAPAPAPFQRPSP